MPHTHVLAAVNRAARRTSGGVLSRACDEILTGRERAREHARLVTESDPPELQEFARHLVEIAQASPHTSRAYLGDLRQLVAFLRERGVALDAATRDDLR